MDMTFLCDGCGSKKTIPDPIRAKVACDCGGKMNALTLITTSLPRMKPHVLPVINPNDERTTLMSLVLSDSKSIHTLPQYKIPQCPNCGFIQVTQAKEKYNCNRCGLINPFRKDGMWNLNLKSTSNQQEAIRICQEQKLEHGVKHEREVEKTGEGTL